MIDVVPPRPTVPQGALKASLAEIMGEFSDGFAFLETAIKSLEHREDCPEVDVLRHGMTAVEAAYDKLDGLTSRLEAMP